MRDDAARVLDIVLACREIGLFIADVDRERFLSDRMLQNAVCRSLEIVGEAARMVSDEFKAAHPQVPWAEMVGLRNRITHEYFRIKLDVVWRIATRDVPLLLGATEPLVPPENPP